VSAQSSSRPALRHALQVYAPVRVTLSALTVLIRALYAGGSALDWENRPYLGITAVEGGWRGLLLGVWQRWDTLWYMAIARDGYGTEDTRIFAPPLYPWLMRAGGNLLGGSDAAYLIAGLVVSNLACIALFVYLYRLVEEEWGEAVARRTIVYLAVFPSAFFLLAAYAESLFILAVVAAFYHGRRGEWTRAGVWGFLAPLARLPGVTIALPLGWEFARQWWLSRRTARPLAWWRAWPIGLVVLGAAAFPLYARLVVGTESLLAPFTVHTQRFMGRFAWPWESLWRAVQVLASGHFRPIEAFDLAFALLFLLLTVQAFRRLPLIYGLYMAVTLLGTLCKVSDVQPLLSVSRYVLVLFPGHVLLAMWGARRAWAHRLLFYLSAAWWMFYAGQFAIWGWVG
jgi:hypothetical protein